MDRPRTFATLFLVSLLASLGPPSARAADRSAIEELRGVGERPHAEQLALPTPLDAPRLLIIGDSWAQYMWDDGSHNDLLDRFGLADHQALSLSLGSDPGPGYTGPEVAVSGSEARQWVDTANYPWLANTVALLEANPAIDRVMLSIGGNDLLAGRPDGGWYKDMDLDTPGSEDAVFTLLETNTQTIIDTILAVRPDIEVVLSSYDYPNFNVGFWCFLYACGKRDDLSRDPVNDLVTDEEINAFMVLTETRRRTWASNRARVVYDNSIGLMHHVYGDGVTGPWTLPRPGILPDLYEPFPGGNPLRPTLRSNFRQPNGIDADPIHLDFDGYRHKIGQQILAHLLPAWRGQPTATLAAAGGGWTDGVQAVTGQFTVGDDGTRRVAAVLDFDLASLPSAVNMGRAALWLSRSSAVGNNPFASGALGTPVVDLATGYFGSSATVDPEDLDAVATMADAAWVVGSVGANAYTLRIELRPAALALLEGVDRAQFRLSFPVVDAGEDRVVFSAGGTPSTQDLATFAWAAGTTAPVLDLDYEIQTAAPSATRGFARLLANQPNPFNPRTRVRMQLDRAMPVRLVLHDLRGRLVRVLFDGPASAGESSYVWDGTDERGRAVASGVYIVALEALGIRDTRRLALVR